MRWDIQKLPVELHGGRVISMREWATSEIEIIEKIRLATRAYEGLIVEGVVVNSPNGGVETTHHIRALYGRAGESGGLRPMSIEMIVDNPGEPHLSQEKLIAEAWIRRDGVVGHFERRFMTGRAAGIVLSEIHLETGHLIRNKVCEAFHHVTHLGVYGHDSDQYCLASKSFSSQVKVVELGEEEVFGVKAKRVRFQLTDYMDLWFEGIAIFEPTFQIISAEKMIEGDAAFVIRKSIGGRTVKQLKIIDGRVIPTEVFYQFDDRSISVNITSVEPLPIDYKGLWLWNNPTGTGFGGPGESSTRVGTDRIVLDELNSYIPFSPEEMVKLSPYIPKPQNKWGLTWFLSFNGLIVAALYFLFWRRSVISKNSDTKSAE